jgi:hypothetical protein
MASVMSKFIVHLWRLLKAKEQKKTSKEKGARKRVGWRTVIWIKGNQKCNRCSTQENWETYQTSEKNLNQNWTYLSVFYDHAPD